MHDGRCIEINEEDYLCACKPGYAGKNCNGKYHKAITKFERKLLHKRFFTYMCLNVWYTLYKAKWLFNNHYPQKLCIWRKEILFCLNREQTLDSVLFLVHGKNFYLSNVTTLLKRRCFEKQFYFFPQEEITFVRSYTRTLTNVTLLFCYQERDLCHPNPCLNGGTCSRTEFGGYRCECTSGYSGTNCTGDDNGNTLRNIKWNYNNTRGPQNWKYLCIIYYVFGKWVSLCIYFNLNNEQIIFYFDSFFCLTPYDQYSRTRLTQMVDTTCPFSTAQRFQTT